MNIEQARNIKSILIPLFDDLRSKGQGLHWDLAFVISQGHKVKTDDIFAIYGQWESVESMKSNIRQSFKDRHLKNRRWNLRAIDEIRDSIKALKRISK